MNKRRGKRFAVASALLAAAGLATTGLGLGGAGAQTDSVPGVTDKTVTVGFIFSETGAASSSFLKAGKTFEARIDRQNAKGGVNGRKIKVEMADDASSAANLTAAKDLVENRKVFMVANSSSFAFLSYRYMLEAGVPMMGAGSDGNYYGQTGNENIISARGSQNLMPGLTSDSSAKVMKERGATKVAALAYGVAPSSVNSAKMLQEYAVPSVGLEAAYTNTSVELGTSDVGPLVLGIKNSGADAAFLPMVVSTNLAVVEGLRQNAVSMKAIVMSTGYGQALLDDPIAKTIEPNVFMLSNFAPVELKTTATKQFMKDRKKYAGLTGVPDLGEYLGYVMGDLTVRGLEAAGKDLTRQGFVDAIHNMGTYDMAGLACIPADVGLEHYGKYPSKACFWYLQVKNGKFVVYKGKPVYGKVVGEQALLDGRTFTPGETATTTTVAK